MKKILFLALAAMLAASCATGKLSPEEKAAQASQKAQLIGAGIANRHFTVLATHMQPLGAPSRTLTYGYEVTVGGDTLKSVLPYVGRGYSVPYGGGSGLHFTTTITDYTSSHNPKGYYEVEIKARNEGQDYVYRLQIFDNGRTNITVISRERDQIHFTGDFDLSK